MIFGVAIRLAMWPLNSRMMRSSIQMQRIAPQVQAAQNKYKGDAEKQREAVMKVYKEAGMSPFAALSGCLPMLLPMPILFALFFVFQNTIEFRGVSFLWLADISLKDPFYILPLAMGAVDVRALVGGNAERAAEPADEDDGLPDAGDDDGGAARTSRRGSTCTTRCRTSPRCRSSG